VTESVRACLIRARNFYGSWKMLAENVGTKDRVLRRIYKRGTVCISLDLLDRVCVQLGEPSFIDDCIWFTAEDCVALRLWREGGWAQWQTQGRSPKGRFRSLRDPGKDVDRKKQREKGKRKKRR
jgi:hypothetical protein